MADKKQTRISRFKKLERLAKSKGFILEKIECGIVDGCKYSVWFDDSSEALCRTLDGVETVIIEMGLI